MRLAYFMNGNGDPLFVADRTGADARQIFLSQQKSMHSHNPVWSPDGQWIYFVHGVDPTEKTDIWRIQPSGAMPERLTEQNAAVNFLAPLDARTLIYTARAQDRTGPALWTLDVPSRTVRKVSSDLERYTSVAASRDGGRMVATIANPSATLWRVPLVDRPIDDRDVQPYPVSTARALAPRFAGASLFYLVSGRVGDSLWHLRDGETSEIVRGADMPLSEPAAVSPDGQRIVVVARRGGVRRLERANAGALDRDTRLVRSGRCRLVARWILGRDRRPRRRWTGALQDPCEWRRSYSDRDRPGSQSRLVARREPDCVRRPTRSRPDRARVGATGRHRRRSPVRPRSSRRLSLPARW
jgi:hypothetical protein